MQQSVSSWPLITLLYTTELWLIIVLPSNVAIVRLLSVGSVLLSPLVC